MAKKKKKKWVTKLRYEHFVGMVLIPSHKGTVLFHRTDAHEDGSKTEYYGIEMAKDEWKNVKKVVKNLEREMNKDL